MARESLYDKIVLGLAAQERQRGVGAPTLPPETPTRTKDDPTIEEAVAANSGVYAGSTRTVEKVGGNKLLKIGLVTTVAGAAGYGIYEAVPAVHRMVDSRFLDHLRGSSEASTVNPFDNAKTKGKISLKNVLFVPQEEFDKTPLADTEGNPILDFPWDSNNPVEMKYGKRLGGRWKENGIVLDPNTEIKNSLEGKTTLPAGFEVRTLYPGRVFFHGSVYNEEASQKSPSNPYGLAIYDGPPNGAVIQFKASNDIFYSITITLRNDKGYAPLDPLIDDTRMGLNEHGLTDIDGWEKGTLVERGQKIFSVPERGTFIIDIGIAGSRKGMYAFPKDQVPVNLKFQTKKDPAGLEKLLVAEGK